MPRPIHAPRVNNNDDEVEVVSLAIAAGDRVAPGQIVGQVETEKAAIDIESGDGGFVLFVADVVGKRVPVGSILAWVGASADEAIPADKRDVAVDTHSAIAAEVTGKARLLILEHGLNIADIPRSGARLTVSDVERYIARQAATGDHVGGRLKVPLSATPATEGRIVELRSEERGMLHTVTWHRDEAVPAYLELGYDHDSWDRWAGEFGAKQNLLFNPLLPLIAHRLVELAVNNPKLNATVVSDSRYEYATVNLGFTVQVGEILYLTVVQNAGSLTQRGFVDAILELQRRAAANKLGPAETQGATIAISSMSRWKVARHIPILAPQTALMVAHTVDATGKGVLGATYDHRVLNGFEVVDVLRELGNAPRSNA